MTVIRDGGHIHIVTLVIKISHSVPSRAPLSSMTKMYIGEGAENILYCNTMALHPDRKIVY